MRTGEDPDKVSIMSKITGNKGPDYSHPLQYSCCVDNSLKSSSLLFT